MVLLDFWTYGCGNCLHVLDELRAVDTEFGEQLVILGVHSPKFEHEKTDSAVASAIDRYEVTHPVFSDPQLCLWRQYAVRAWPTLVLIDPAGYVIAQAAGEGHADSLAMIIRQTLAEWSGAEPSSIHPYRAVDRPDGELRFPAKALVAGDSLFIADAGHHQIVETGQDGGSVRRRIGDGRRGTSDQSFTEPNGLTRLPPEVAERVGFDLVVADTGSHTLRGVRRADGAIVCTVDLSAGLAEARTITGAVPAVLSPWDAVWWPALQRVVVAAAGVHLLLSWDPESGAVEILAGTTVEGLKDGPALDGWLAQPSGLAVDGDRLWFVDSETSALRYLTAAGELVTPVGEGLFDFGLVDGPAAHARLQHPLGVAVLPDGSIGIADTYNGAVRRYDPATSTVSTLAADLDEPSGLVVVGPDVLVVESGAHRLVRLDAAKTLAADPGAAMQTERPVTDVAAGTFELTVAFTPPPGRHLDDRFDPSVQLSVSATPTGLLLDGVGSSDELNRTLVLAGSPGTTGVLQVTAQAAACDEGEHSACHLARQDWGVPVRITAGGVAELRLVLLD